MKKVILFLFVVLFAACTSQPQRNIEKALKAGPDNFNSYKFVDLSVSKSITVSECLDIKLKKFSERLYNASMNVTSEENRNFLTGKREHSAKDKYNELSSVYHQLNNLVDSPVVKSKAKYASIYKITFSHRIGGETVEGSKYFIVGVDNSIIDGPYSNYSDAFSAYSEYNLNHIDGYSSLILPEL